MRYTLASLADVPKHSRWIHNISDPKAPWLHRRRSRRRDIELSRQVKRIDMPPPSVKIIDHELHHKVFCPVLLIIGLKYETAGACPEDRHISVQKFFEPQSLIEVLGRRKSLAGMNGRASSVPVGTCFIFSSLRIRARSGSPDRGYSVPTIPFPILTALRGLLP